jgi:hypothetical protein
MTDKKFDIKTIEQIAEALYDRFLESKVLRIGKKHLSPIKEIHILDRNILYEELINLHKIDSNSDNIIKSILDEALENKRHIGINGYEDDFLRKIYYLLNPEIKVAIDDKNNGIIVLNEEELESGKYKIYSPKNLDKLKTLFYLNVSEDILYLGKSITSSSSKQKESDYFEHLKILLKKYPNGCDNEDVKNIFGKKVKVKTLQNTLSTNGKGVWGYLKIKNKLKDVNEKIIHITNKGKITFKNTLQ